MQKVAEMRRYRKVCSLSSGEEDKIEGGEKLTYVSRRKCFSYFFKCAFWATPAGTDEVFFQFEDL